MKKFVTLLLWTVLSLALVSGVTGVTHGGEPAPWSAEKRDDQTIRIYENGSFFTDWRPDVEGNPILWPLCSRGGLLMTRSIPMIDSITLGNDTPDLEIIYRRALAARHSEANDHPHHRSIWMNHGQVNGKDFWSLIEKNRIEVVAVESLKTDETGVTLTTKNRWLDVEANKVVCTDRRVIHFGTTECGGRLVRAIDYDITVFASEGAVTFGETKEGSFGLRVPGTMDVTASSRKGREGESNPAWGGRIRNSNGQENGDAWGKRADWVDYSGPIPACLTEEQLASGTETAEIPLAEGGLVVMNHPKSFRYPTWWHVRTYGLFAANPFGGHMFGEKGPNADGTLELAAGDSFSLGYRILLYDGQMTVEDLAGAWSNYVRREGPEHPEQE